MDQSVSRVKVEDIEAALSEVGEIKAARIVAAPDGSIAEIHVLALPTKAPKQLVRDIESTLMARFGIPVDHKKISIALLGRDAIKEDAPVPRALDGGASPHLLDQRDGQRRSGLGVGVARDRRHDFVGTASGPASQTGRARLVALATLDAVSQYTDATISFALEDVAIVQLGREKVAVSCIALVSGFGEQHFSGSALVRQNDNDSIVRATLDAINRRMGFLTTA